MQRVITRYAFVIRRDYKSVNFFSRLLFVIDRLNIFKGEERDVKRYALIVIDGNDCYY